MNREALLNQFSNAEQKLEFSKILDGAAVCLKQHEPVFSGFLDPLKAGAFVHAVLREESLPVNVVSFGGYPQAERRMLGLCPGDMALSDEDFPIDAVEMTYNAKFGRPPSHRDFLGALLGLGIERRSVGDIVPAPGRALVVVHRKLAGYVCANMEKAGSTRVKADVKRLADVTFPQSSKQARKITLSSLRIDNVVSACFHVSRREAAALIAAERVYVNWIPVSGPSKPVSEKDAVTVRGMGRVEIGEMAGRTKKGKWILEVFEPSP